MAYSSESLQIMGAIYKYVFKNPGVHRNVLRKKLISDGKVSSKAKFATAFEGLIALGNLNIDKELVSINSNILSIGLLQREGNDFYVVTPNSNKHLKISKSIAAGYNPGDILDIVVEYNGGAQEVFVLGRSNKEFVQQSHKKQQKKEVFENSFEDKQNLVLGRVLKLSHDELVFIPNKKSFETRQIPILNNKEEYASFQDKICVMNLMNIEAPLLGGYITEVKGDAGNPIHEYDAIAESYGAVMDWKGLEPEIEKIPTEIDVEKLDLISEEQAKYSQRKKVVDLRNIPFATIDPATCKDMDDAIYSTFDENGDIVVYTAVANVTKYVDLNSGIGEKYINGAFTIYAPNKAYNILPTKLSTGICSLNPNEDRLAFVVRSVLDKSTGKVKHSDIYDAVIRSRQKYSYEEAQEIADKLDHEDGKRELMHKFYMGKEFSPEEQILMNYYAAQTIKFGFEQRKMIRFNANKEREIVFDSDLQDVVDILPIKHLLYHEVIESFMITANEATAKYAKDNNLDNVYRVHEAPNPKKVDRANEFFDILGIDFDGDLSAQGTRTLIEMIRDSANEEVVNRFLIKMQSRAVYSDKLYSDKKKDRVLEWGEEQISHYALQSPHYSHTTAPIRRVLDYVTQYNILAHIHGTAPIKPEFISKIIENANQRQIDIDQAEKDFDDISSVIYCEKHIGEEMSGRVSKIRYASPEEGYEDEIVVIVKNEEKGISVEIPLSHVLGRRTYDCSLSEQGCAVYDGRGNAVLTLCKPIDFIIEKADRKAMIVIGKTNKQLVNRAEIRVEKGRQHYSRDTVRNAGAKHMRDKRSRDERIRHKKEHHESHNDLEEKQK